MGGMPGSLKNAVDYLFHAWTGKPALLVSYGIFGGKAASDNLCAILSGAMKMGCYWSDAPASLP